MGLTDGIGRTAAELLSQSAETAWVVDEPWPTGFARLDASLNGGLQAGELTVLAGAQGLGKTTLALQMARNVVRAGGRAGYVCYEHSDRQLLQRLVAMETGLAAPHDEPVSLTDIRRALASLGSSEKTAAVPPTRLLEAIDVIRGYGERLRLVGARATEVDLEVLAELVWVAGSERAAIFIDYLQKVPIWTGQLSEDERVTRVVERLKDLALEHNVPIVAIVAIDKSGLGTARTRLQDLRGSTALAYEADVALILNDKHKIVARHHLVYGTPEAARFHEYVVCSIEKNRGGRAGADIDLHKAFERGGFDPADGLVAEQLRDERVYVD